MTDKEKITEILKDYTKKHNISASSVILEEYAEELIRQGVTMPIRCKDCKWLYKPSQLCTNKRNRVFNTGVKRDFNCYCSYGERKCE